MKELQASDFHAAIENNDVPVLVDFCAPWCSFCIKLSPALEQVAQQVGENAVIAKVNVDEVPEIASECQIDGIPALLLFKGGKLLDRLEGLQSADEIMRMINRHC